MGFGDEMSLIVITAIAFIIYLRNIHNTNLWFCVFLFMASLGSYYNEMYQMANSIVPADLGLLLFAGSYVISRRNNMVITKRCAYIWLIAVYMFFLGVLYQREFGQILRDCKVFIYFFAAYFYCDQNKEDECFVSLVIKTICISILFTIIACSYSFLSYGIHGITTSGKIDRVFGIGLSQYGLAMFLFIFWTIREHYKGVWKKTIIWVFMLLSLVLCIVSYTRSVWMQLIISLCLYVFFVLIVGKKEISINSFIRFILGGIIAIVLIVYVINITKTHFPDLYNVIFDRFLSIGEMGTGSQTDTMTYRANDILKYSEKYYSPQFIFGWGFGDKLHGEISGIVENSFLYYTWKYGLVLSLFLGYKILRKMYILFCRSDKISLAILSVLISYLIAGGISGHLNKYYILPFMAIFFTIDFSDYYRTNELRQNKDMTGEDDEE